MHLSASPFTLRGEWMWEKGTKVSCLVHFKTHYAMNGESQWMVHIFSLATTRTQPTITQVNEKWGARSEGSSHENIALMLFGFSSLFFSSSLFLFSCAQIANITENTAAHSSLRSKLYRRCRHSHQPAVLYTNYMKNVHRRSEQNTQQSRYHNNTTAKHQHQTLREHEKCIIHRWLFLSVCVCERAREFFERTFYFLFLTKTFKLTLTAPDEFVQGDSVVCVCVLHLSCMNSLAMFIFRG